MTYSFEMLAVLTDNGCGILIFVGRYGRPAISSGLFVLFVGPIQLFLSSLVIFSRESCIIMPRGKRHVEIEDKVSVSRKPATKPDEVGWGGFINVKLSDDQKADYAVWLEGDGAGFWSMLCDVISQEFKYSLAYDNENAVFVASLTGQGVNGSDDRYCLTARAGTMEGATALLVFKDQVLLEQDWGRYRPRTGGAEVD